MKSIRILRPKCLKFKNNARHQDLDKLLDVREQKKCDFHAICLETLYGTIIPHL